MAERVGWALRAAGYGCAVARLEQGSHPPIAMFAVVVVSESCHCKFLGSTSFVASDANLTFPNKYKSLWNHTAP